LLLKKIPAMALIRRLLDFNDFFIIRVQWSIEQSGKRHYVYQNSGVAGPGPAGVLGCNTIFKLLSSFIMKRLLILLYWQKHTFFE